MKKPIYYSLVSITITENPWNQINDPFADLKLNGFSVTLEELDEMYKVGVLSIVKGKAL